MLLRRGLAWHADSGCAILSKGQELAGSGGKGDGGCYVAGSGILRVLMVCPYFPPEVYGGKEVWIKNVAKELSALGHDVWVWTSSIRHRRPVLTHENGVRVLWSPVVANLKTYWTPIVIPKLPFADHFDLYHLAEPYATGSTLASLRARITGTPIVISYHNDPLPLRAYDLSGPVKMIYDATITAYGRTLNMLKLRWARKIVVFTKAQLRRSVYLRGKLVQKVELVPMGVDRALLDSVAGNDGSVLFVGRIDFRKGVHHLIAAMVGLNRDLVVVGSGDFRQVKYIEELGRNRLGERFKMIGNVPSGRLRELYSQCSVLVLPSIDPMETFGGVILEAMGAGKPVVCTRIVGISGLVEHTRTGLVVDSADPPRLREAIRTLLHDPGQAFEMGRRGRMVAADLTYDKVARKMLSVYEEAVRN